MPHITRRSVEECIMVAHTQYLTSTAGNIICATTDNGNITVQCAINNDRFNCGISGNQMNANETNNLRHWCTTHPGNGWVFGFRDVDHAHPHNVNITLINQTDLMFNFHVYLY
jgi:hypothetical protein|tara:strand:+ start:124 stop:462 length:339 start_codon:yes stop_codon:yes gene_type:complete